MSPPCEQPALEPRQAHPDKEAEQRQHGDAGEKLIGLHEVAGLHDEGADPPIRADHLGRDDEEPETLTIGPPDDLVQIDVPGHKVVRCGEQVQLTPLEFDLLVALARKPNTVFTREVLLEQVWHYRHAADTRLVNVHVRRLRAKVERDPERPQVVVTVRGVGYKAGPA